MPAPLIERYREHLPLEEGDPVVTLNEGSTPLIHSPRLSDRVGAEVYFKFEGANPTGSFKDRGMTVAVSRAKGAGAEAIICASTGNTGASWDARSGDRPRGQDRDRQARPGTHARRPSDRARGQLRPGARDRPGDRE